MKYVDQQERMKISKAEYVDIHTESVRVPVEME